jgi:hypothetical protein
MAKKFATAIKKSLVYAQSHPDEIRALLPAGTGNVRLPIWSPIVDRTKLVQTAKYARDFDVISKLPNMLQLVPRNITGGKTLQGTLTKTAIRLLLDGRTVKTLPQGEYTFVVSDRSKTGSFRLKGPGVTKTTPVKGVGRYTWTVLLAPGKYTYTSAGSPALKKTFRVLS